MKDRPRDSLPTVTVLLAAHNRLDLLKESVASAVTQTYPSFEVLVVDDGSDAATVSWLDETAHRFDRLRVIHQDWRGAAAARTLGLREARGDLVCILDSDDRLVPDALDRIVPLFLDDRTPVDLVYTDNQCLMPDGTATRRPYPTYPDNRSMIRATLLRPRVPFKHSGTTMRRGVAVTLGGYDASLPVKIDVDLFLRFLANGRRLMLLAEPVVQFRFHRNSLSARRIAGLKVWWYLIDRYGPSPWFARGIYKGIRAGAELLKLLYLVRLRL